MTDAQAEKVKKTLDDADIQISDAKQLRAQAKRVERLDAKLTKIKDGNGDIKKNGISPYLSWFIGLVLGGLISPFIADKVELNAYLGTVTSTMVYACLWIAIQIITILLSWFALVAYKAIMYNDKRLDKIQAVFDEEYKKLPSD